MRRTWKRNPSIAAALLAAAGLLAVVHTAAVHAAGPQPPGAQPPGAQPPSEHRQQAHGHDGQGRHMEHRFDDPERYARMFDDPARDEWQMPERVIAALGIAPGESVADIGAGTGYFTVRLARQTPARAVFAVDIEPAMVDYVRRRAADAGLDQVVGVVAEPDSANLPEPVDVVLIVNTFHHLPDRVAYFTALRDRMTAGARLAIIDPRKGAPGGGPPDEFRFTPEEIGDELGRAGFELLARHDFLPRQSFLVYRQRQESAP